MSFFSAEFPVQSTYGAADFAATFRTWILGSRHTQFTSALLVGIETENSFEAMGNDEQVSLLKNTYDGTQSMAIRYIKQGNGLKWTTELVFSSQQSDAWVSVRTSCQAYRPAVELPTPKKPIIVSQLLEKFGGAKDGPLIVQNKPHYLGNGDIELAARLINGSAGCYLPIIYISSPFDGQGNWNADKLADDLAGMAHVVVEPNRPFSNRLKIDVDSRNVYGGALGIYWPNSDGVRTIFRDGSNKVQKDVLEHVRLALTNRLPLTRCAWYAVQKDYYHKAQQELKDSGSEELSEYYALFESETQALKSQHEYYQNEIDRLKAEIRRLEAKNLTAVGTTLKIGNEQDIYPEEIMEVILDAIRDAESRVYSDSRRRHILNDVLKNNQTAGIGAKNRASIKEMLRGYKSMDSKLRQNLRDMGFDITEEGKHYKLRLNDDDRYTFALSKSGSDSRGGMNAAADISRLFF